MSLGFCLWQSKTTVAAQIAEWPVLMCDPRKSKYFILFYFILRASILINEWVSLWTHCTVWGLGLHDSHKFLSHLRKPKLARRSLVTFLQSKALMYSPHFYPDKFDNGSQIEGKCQISLLSTQPRPLSPLQRSNLGILQLSPGYSLIFFHNWDPLPSTFPLGGQFPWHRSASLPPSIFWLSGNFSVSFNWAHSVSRPWVSMPQMFQPGPSLYLSYLEGAGNLLHHQIKLIISTNTGDSRTRRDLPKFVCTLRGGRWARGDTAGTKAPVPRGVQSKEGGTLWVTSAVAMTVD